MYNKFSDSLVHVWLGSDQTGRVFLANSVGHSSMDDPSSPKFLPRLSRRANERNMLDEIDRRVAQLRPKSAAFLKKPSNVFLTEWNNEIEASFGNFLNRVQTGQFTGLPKQEQGKRMLRHSAFSSSAKDFEIESMLHVKPHTKYAPRVSLEYGPTYSRETLYKNIREGVDEAAPVRTRKGSRPRSMIRSISQTTTFGNKISFRRSSLVSPKSIIQNHESSANALGLKTECLSQRLYSGKQAVELFNNDCKYQQFQAHSLTMATFDKGKKETIAMPKAFYLTDRKAQLSHLLETSEELEDLSNRFVEIEGGRASLQSDCSMPLRNMQWREDCPRQQYIKTLMGQKIAPELSFIQRDKSRSLDKLDFSHFSLGDPRATAVSSAIAKLSFVKHINLSDNRLRNKALLNVCQNLTPRSNEIETLDLSKNQFGADASSALVGLLNGGMRALTSLVIREARIGDQCGTNIIEAIGHKQSDCKALRILDMSGNRLSGKSAMALGHMVSKRHIAVLDVSENFISGAGAIAIAKSLGKNKSIKKLLLQGNSFGASIRLGMVKGVIEVHPSLANQNVSGIDYLSMALVDNETIYHLDISRNAIGPKAMFCLSQALVANSTLHTLKANGNAFLEVGSRALIRAVEHGISLSKLEIQNCDVIGHSDNGIKVFDPLDPVHQYGQNSIPALCMSIPYDYFVACAIVRMGEDYPGFVVEKLICSEEGEINLKKRPVDSNTHDLKAYKKMFRNLSVKHHPGQSAFVNINTAWITYDDTKTIIRNVHERRHEGVCDRYLNAFLDQADEDNNGQIEWREFCLGIRAARNMFGIGARHRGEPLPGVMCTGSSKRSWCVPRKGTLQVLAKCIPCVIPGWRCCTEYSFRKILLLAKATGDIRNTCLMIHLSTRDMFYRAEQAALLIDLIMEVEGVGGVEKFADVFLAVVDKENSAALFNQVLTPTLQTAVRNNLHNLFSLAMGMYNGRYSLNLSDTYRDRRAALTLLQRQACELGLINSFTYSSKNQHLIDTSQSQNEYHCLRNVTWVGLVEEREDVMGAKEKIVAEVPVDVAAYYTTLPLETSGIFRCDFVQAIGPEPNLSVMSPLQFHRFCKRIIYPILEPVMGYRFVHRAVTVWEDITVEDHSERDCSKIETVQVVLASPFEQRSALKLQCWYRVLRARRKVRAAHKNRILLTRRRYDSENEYVSAVKIQKFVRRLIAQSFTRHASLLRASGMMGAPRPTCYPLDKTMTYWLFRYCNPSLRRRIADSELIEDTVVDSMPPGEYKTIWHKPDTSAKMEAHKSDQRRMDLYWQWCNSVQSHPHLEEGSLHPRTCRNAGMLKRLEFANKEDARTLRRVLFCIAKVLAGKTFTARQICDLVSLLPKGLGKGREELCVQLFSRCCDPENFEHGVFPLLCEESQYELQLRLGILNLWNPCFPERNYILNLAVMDERKLADHLLAFDEVEKSYDKQEHLDQVHIFLTRDNISFGKPKTLPKEGIFSCRYVSRNVSLMRRNGPDLLEHEKHRENVLNEHTFSGRVRNQYHNYHALVYSVVLVQKHTRGLLARKVLKHAKLILMKTQFADRKERQAAYVLQAAIRRYIVRKYKNDGVASLRSRLKRLSMVASLPERALKYRLYAGLFHDFLKIKMRGYDHTTM